MKSISQVTLAFAHYVAAVKLGDAVHDPIFAPIAPEHYMSAADLTGFAGHAAAELAAHETAVLRETVATNEALDALVAHYGQIGDTDSALAELGETLAQLGAGHANDLRVWWGDGYPEEPETQDEADATEDEADVQEEEADVPVVEACTKELNPPENKRFYSSTSGGAAQGADWAASMLDSTTCWWPAEAEGQWMEIDAEQEEMIAGVVMQGRAYATGNPEYFVTQVRLEYSTDNVTWAMAHSGEALETSVQKDDGMGARYEVPFDAPVRARYVRITPTEYEGPEGENAFPGLRAGLLA